MFFTVVVGAVVVVLVVIVLVVGVVVVVVVPRQRRARRGVAYLIATRSGLYYGSCFERVLAAVNGSLPHAERLNRSDLYKVMRGAYRFNCHKG